MKHKKTQTPFCIDSKILAGILVMSGGGYALLHNAARAQESQADSSPLSQEESVSNQGAQEAAPESTPATDQPPSSVPPQEPTTQTVDPTQSSQEPNATTQQPDTSTPIEPKEAEPREKTKKKKKNDTEQAAAKAENYDERTPAALKNRLRIGLGGSLGLGTGPSDDFSSDYLGYYVQGAYGFSRFAAGQSPWSMSAVGRYSTHTGIYKDQSREVVVQRFLLGSSLEYKNGESPYRFGAIASFGLAKVVGAEFSTSDAYSESYHFDASVEGFVAFRIYSKLAFVTGFEVAPVSDHTWYGLQLGTLFSF